MAAVGASRAAPRALVPRSADELFYRLRRLRRQKKAEAEADRNVSDAVPEVIRRHRATQQMVA